MNSLYEFFRGSADMRIAGAEPERFLNVCAENGILFWGLERRGGELFFTVTLADLPYMRPCAEAAGCSCELLKKSGAPAFLRQFRKRFFLIAGLAAAVLLMFILNQRVWEISVEGAESVPEYKILAALAEEGVKAGARGSEVSPRALKNAILLRVPGLSWFTINVNGSKAEVVVREATKAPETVDESAVADLVALREGVVTEVRAYAGTPQILKGGAVLKGETLIKGEVMHGETPVPTRALGEVRARTLRTLTACRPLQSAQTAPSGGKKTKISLVFAEKRINLYADSSILWEEYGKITTKKNISLFGALELPVAVVVQRLEERVRSLSRQSAEAELMETLEAELARRLEKSKGEALSKSWATEERGGVLYVTLSAECGEIISGYDKR